MSRGKRELSPDEKRLWRHVATGVKTRRALPKDEAQPEEVAPPPPPAPLRPAPKPTPRVTAKRTTPPPADRGAERRVRRGQIDVAATLDLHGHTQDSARAAVIRFLGAAHARGDSAVIIVTGVGRGGEGVLKRRLRDWLAEAAVRPLISGYAQAHRAHGGAGAFYVFIKRKRESSD